MYWIDEFKLAEIHRETYAAIIQSWVPHGKKDEFARKCGITREYLSCLCVLDGKIGGNVPIHKRYSSPQVAKKIANALPAPDEIRQSLAENMELSHICAARAYYKTTGSIEQGLLADQLSQVGAAHQEATFGKESSMVKRAYRIVRNISAALLRQVDPEEHPDSFAQACLYYSDSQCVLNRPDEALRYARLAQVVLESFDEVEPGFTERQREDLEINAIRGEAVAYHNLGLDRKAPAILVGRARLTSAFRNARRVWEPIINRDIMNAMVKIPRFSIRDVNRSAREAALICESTGDELTLLLIQESWLRSLIAHGRWKQAQQVFDEEINRLRYLSHVGALHKVLVLKGGAQLAWKMHDLEAWRVYITRTLCLEHQAGLSHQMESIRRYYGTAIIPICAELGST